MKNDNFENKNVAILGLGVEGVATAKYLTGKCKEITFLDQKGEEHLVASGIDGVEELLSDPKFKKELGPDYLNNLNKYDIIFRSPGIPYLNPKIQEAQAAGVEITSQIKLFFDLCPCPIIGVTGTKGKGTTASLIESMMQKAQISNDKLQIPLRPDFANAPRGYEGQVNSNPPAGGQNQKVQKNVYLAGNIGRPAIEFIDELSDDDIVILELSSFQTQDLTVSPHIAVITNISVDHLDYHRDEKEYVSSKESIVQFQNKDDYAVINQDYLTSFEFASKTAGETYFFSGKNSVDQGGYVRKKQETPLRPAESAGYEGQAKNKKQESSKLQITNQQIYEVVLRMEDQEEVVCSSDQIKLVGWHNLENIAAASIAAYLSGAGISDIKSAVRNFDPLPHRLEFVAEISGVTFYNDSFATNPDPTIAAVNSFSEDKILILGGSGKGSDFHTLAQKITESNVTDVILIGDEADKIKKALSDTKYGGEIVEAGKDFDLAVKKATEIAKTGDVIIFSPACASFDMFKNYKDRGNKFREMVLKYK